MANKNEPEKQGAVDLPPWRRYDMKINMENYNTEEPLFNAIKSRDKLSMWEVYNGKVKEVDNNEHFKFYDNRAYVVLSDKEVHNPEGQTSRFCHLHIWVARFCSGQDYQLAVVRAEQLENMLDIKAFLHREIEIHETDVFHNHDAVIEVRRSEGSEGESPHPNLFQFRMEDTAHGVNAERVASEGTSKRLKRKWMIEKKCLRGNLCSDDVFVLKHIGDLRIFQWNGRHSHKEKRTMATNIIEQEKKNLKDRLQKKITTAIVDEGTDDKNHYMYSLILKVQKQQRSGSIDQGSSKPKSLSEGSSKKPSDESSKDSKGKKKKLYRLTDDGGHFMDYAKEDPHTTISRNNLKTNYVYLLDTDYIAYVWIGEDWVCQDEGEQGRLNLILEFADKLLVSKYAGSDNEGSDRFHQPINKPITLVDENDHYVPLNKLLRD